MEDIIKFSISLEDPTPSKMNLFPYLASLEEDEFDLR